MSTSSKKARVCTSSSSERGIGCSPWDSDCLKDTACSPLLSPSCSGARCDLVGDVIGAMMRQESTTYACPDYAKCFLGKRADQPGLPQATTIIDDNDAHIECHQRHDDDQDGIAREQKMKNRRETICEWLYQVIDQCDLSREIVAVSISFFDRYVALVSSERADAVNGCFLQLVALTSLYLATKLDGQKGIQIDHLARLSSGRFSPKDIVDMELSMLNALGWNVHPPTAVSFVHKFLELLPDNATLSNGDDLRPAVFEVARFFTELSVMDYQLSVAPHRPSTIAYASILNAMDLMGNASHIPPQVPQFLSQCMMSLKIDLHPASQDVRAVGEILRGLYMQSYGVGGGDHNSAAPTMLHSQREVGSPVCVSGVDIQPPEQQQHPPPYGSVQIWT